MDIAGPHFPPWTAPSAPTCKGIRMTDRTVPRRGFTLVELLVVVAIIALLIGVLLPAIGSARNAARSSAAQSNVRQITLALMTYANDFKQQFPPVLNNIPDKRTGKRNMNWYDDTRIGAYIPQFDESNLNSANPKNQTVGGGVFTSPMHQSAGRSFTMNFWAASAASWGPVNGRLKTYKPGENPFDSSEGDRGKAFDPNVAAASNTMLIADAWGMWPGESPAGYSGEKRWFTGAHIGRSGLPGARFGGGESPVDAALQETQAWRIEGAPEMASVAGNALPTYVPFYRYPKPNYNDALTRQGSAMFGFVDGHADPIKASTLVDGNGRSTFRVLWSPIDRRIEDTSSGN